MQLEKILTLCLLIGSLFAMMSCSDFSSRAPDSHAARLLPGPPEQWDQAGATRVFTGAALSDYINGGAEAYLAYGFRQVAARDFEKDSGARLTVEVYEMDRSENAYGIFSTDSAGDRWNIGADASYDSGLLRFWKGPYFVRVLCYPPDPQIEAVIRQTGETIAAAIEAQGGSPGGRNPDGRSPESRRPELFLSLLPETAVVPDSVCFFHRQTSLNNIRFLSDENLLRLGDYVDAITWEEQVQATGAAPGLRQIALRYLSEEEAKAAFEAFAGEYLKSDASDPAESHTPVTAKLKNDKYATAGRGAAWVVIVLDASSADASAEAASRTLAKTEAAKKSEGRS